MMAKERLHSSSKAKQSVLELTSPAKRTVSGEMKIVESKTLDSTIANFIYENALSFHVADTQSFAAVVDQCIEFGQQHPGRKYKAPTRRRIGGPLLEVISALSCERNWSAYGHIHSEVRNRLAPATTEKLVYVYSNWRAVAAAARDD
jgi:hypothetical protein